MLARRFTAILPDAAIARRAGVNEPIVRAARRKLGIPARKGSDLDSNSARE